MAVLTWRNVDAPNFSNSIEAQRLVGNSINNAAELASGAIDKFAKARTQQESAALMSAALQDPANVNAALQAANPAYLTPDALEFIAKNQQVQARLDAALSGSGRGGRGGGGGRRGSGNGGDGAPVAGNNLQGTYVDGVFVPAATAQVTPAPAPSNAAEAIAQVAAAQPAIANTNGPTLKNAAALRAALPQSESTVGVPVGEPSMADLVAPQTVAAPVAPVVNPAPQLIAQSVNGQVRAPTGDVNTPAKFDKGDPLKQVNRNAMENIGKDRLFGAEGVDPLGGVRSLLNDEHFLRNTGVAGGLAVMDKTLDFSKNADAAVQSRQKTIEGTQEFNKRQQDKVIDENAFNFAQDTASNYFDAGSAKADILPRIPDLKQRARVEKQIDEVSKLGAWDVTEDSGSLNGDQYRPAAYLNIGSITGELPTTPDQDANQLKAAAQGKAPDAANQVADPKTIDQALAPTPTPPSIEKGAALIGSYQGSALDGAKERYTQYKETLHDDQGGDDVARLLTDYNKLRDSKRQPIDVANDLLGEKGAFRTAGATPAQLTSLIERLSKQTGKSPELIGRILQTVPRDQTFWDNFRIGATDAELATDNSRLQPIIDFFVDKNGKPTPNLMQNLNRLRDVDRKDKQADAAMGILERAQSEYDKVVVQKNAGRAQNVNLDLYKRNLDVAQDQFNRIIARNMDPVNGIAYQNNGSPVAPKVENRIGPFSTVTGPATKTATDVIKTPVREITGTNKNVQALLDQATGQNAEQTTNAIYRELVSDLGKRPNPQQATDLRNKAQKILEERLGKNWDR